MVRLRILSPSMLNCYCYYSFFLVSHCLCCADFLSTLYHLVQKKKRKVLEERQDHAESIRYFVITKILNLLGGCVDTPGSLQSIKSESFVVLINMELRYRFRPRRETDLIPGL